MIFFYLPKSIMNIFPPPLPRYVARNMPCLTPTPQSLSSVDSIRLCLGFCELFFYIQKSLFFCPALVECLRQMLSTAFALLGQP